MNFSGNRTITCANIYEVHRNDYSTYVATKRLSYSELSRRKFTFCCGCVHCRKRINKQYVFSKISAVFYTYIFKITKYCSRAFVWKFKQKFRYFVYYYFTYEFCMRSLLINIFPFQYVIAIGDPTKHMKLTEQSVTKISSVLNLYASVKFSFLKRMDKVP